MSAIVLAEQGQTMTTNHHRAALLRARAYLEKMARQSHAIAAEITDRGLAAPVWTAQANTYTDAADILAEVLATADGQADELVDLIREDDMEDARRVMLDERREARGDA